MSADSSVMTFAARRKTLVAIAIGNFMEWFDWGMYGFFATIIGAQFFPEGTPEVQLLSVFAVFAAGFFFRPLGGFFFGPLADRRGRRVALATAVIMMGLGTMLLGLLPSYAQIGIWAPILLIVCRCVQGFSTGGEAAGSNTFAVEIAPIDKRARYGSITSMTSAFALLTSSLLALWITTALSAEDLAAWGWRVPFLIAFPLSLIGLYLRLRLDDSPVFKKLKATGNVDERSLWQKLVTNRKAVFLTLITGGFQGAAYYYLATYAVNFLTVTVGLERVTALWLSATSLAIYLVMCGVSGVLVDRFGRRRMTLVGTVGMMALIIPAFLLIGLGQPALIILGLGIIAVCQSFITVASVVLMVELFPAGARTSGAATGFNIGVVGLSGPAPYIATGLTAALGTPLAPAFYLLGLGVVALPTAIWLLPETKGADLNRVQDMSNEEIAV